MDSKHALRKVYTGERGTPGYIGDPGISPTTGEIAEELAQRIIEFFGSTRDSRTPEHVKALKSHLLTEGARWVNNEFDIGLSEGPS